MHFAFSRTALSPHPHLVTTVQTPPSTLESSVTHNGMMTCRPQAHSGNACAPQGDPNNRASVRKLGSHPLFSSFLLVFGLWHSVPVLPTFTVNSQAKSKRETHSQHRSMSHPDTSRCLLLSSRKLRELES